jgi:hypothetical protein
VNNVVVVPINQDYFLLVSDEDFEKAKEIINNQQDIIEKGFGYSGWIKEFRDKLKTKGIAEDKALNYFMPLLMEDYSNLGEKIKEFFDNKDSVSDIWKNYLIMLYYEKSKINIHKYMEELISDYYDEPNYEIAVYRHF